MTIKAHVDSLWQQFREAIDTSWQASKNDWRDERSALRDYSTNVGWTDALEKLLEREIKHERLHRRGTGAPFHISAHTSARLLIIHNASDGAKLSAMPPAVSFITYRDTAAEAQLVGYLIRAAVTPEWLEAAQALDYAKEIR